MSTYVDLGDSQTRGLAVLLPGFSPLFSMPLLLSAASVALAHGWRVRLVHWDPPESREPDWVVAELEAAVDEEAGAVLVVGKSLATLAAHYVAERGWDAIWLTPLLHRPDVAEAIARHPGRQLLVGGTADEAWRADVARTSGAEVVEVTGGDHGLTVGDAVRSAEVHVDVVRRIDGWFRGPHE